MARIRTPCARGLVVGQASFSGLVQLAFSLPTLWDSAIFLRGALWIHSHRYNFNSGRVRNRSVLHVLFTHARRVGLYCGDFAEFVRQSQCLSCPVQFFSRELMPAKLKISLPGSNTVYYSGSTIAGSVLLDVKKIKDYQRISVQFIGRSCVSWEGRRAESVENITDDVGNRGRRSSTMTASASTESYVNVVTTVWKSINNAKLSAGQYSWPFSFDIPPSVPSSFEGNFGNIRYTLVGQIVTGKIKARSDHSVELQVPIQQIVRITDPRLLQPLNQEVQRTVQSLWCTSPPIIMSVSVPKTGFNVGESFHLQVSLENGSGRRITITAVIKQLVTFNDQGGLQNQNEKALVTMENQMAPRTIRSWDPTIEIPTGADVIDETACSNIKVTHSMIITAKVSASSLCLSTFFPIKLGKEQQYEAASTEAAAAATTTFHPQQPLAVQKSIESLVPEKFPLSSDSPPSAPLQHTHWSPAGHPGHDESQPPPYTAAVIGGWTYGPPSAPPHQPPHGSSPNVFVY